MTVRVVVVDDHPVVRAGVRSVIESELDLEVVGEAGDATSAAAVVAESDPDVVVLDLVLPGATELSLLERLVESWPGVRVVVLSAHDATSTIRGALAAGAHGFVPKQTMSVDLVAAIREVARGGAYLHAALGARLVEGPPPAPSSSPAVECLSAREREIMLLLARGHTNREIATKLDISVRTAESHRTRLMRKLGVATRADLVTLALARGLLRAEG